jgi:D-3-phosphoglycerate dehydrogenase
MNVVAYDPYASEEKARAVGVRLVSFEEALGLGDFFSLHMPLTPGTKNMFNDSAFAKMKKGARIMNVARGGVIDDLALAKALDDGIVAAAALDVFEEEPPAFEGHPLIGRPNVVCTPHLGASTTEAQEGVSTEVAEAVIDALQGKLSATAVNAPLVSAEVLKELAPYVTLAEGLGKVSRCRRQMHAARYQVPIWLPHHSAASFGLPPVKCCWDYHNINCPIIGGCTCFLLVRSRHSFGVAWPLFCCLQAAVSLVADQGFTDINICYSSPRGDDLDTRLLRAMVIKGILEETTTANVNLVNADLLAKNRGLRISEVTIRTEGRSGYRR